MTLRERLGRDKWVTAITYKTFDERLLDVEVIAVWDPTFCGEPSAWTDGFKEWPGPPRKFMYSWYELANGKAVGFNESPSHGWSFPVATVPESDRYQP